MSLQVMSIINKQLGTVYTVLQTFTQYYEFNVNRAFINIIKCCLLCIIISPLNPIIHFWLHHTVHCAEKIVSVGLYAGPTSADMMGQRGGGWGHPQSDMHVVAARLGCKRGMAGTGWTTSGPGSMDRLRKHYFHIVGDHFWQGKLLGLWAGV